jgi:broad specificity phosphatase PhoE
MSTQLIYIARHGLTLANEGQYVQDASDPLSERGHRQAMRLSERAKHLEFDRLLSSDMLRAQETAEYIARATGHVIVAEPLVREVRRPSALHGTMLRSPAHQALLAEERAHFHDPSWRAGDGENFADLSARALSALERFESFGAETLFVVSHGHFIRALIATVLMERELTPEVWRHISRTIRTHNTGITILSRATEANHWTLVSSNDHAHFADD